MTDITSFPIPTQVFNPDDFAGADGREVELQSTATHIQWRYAGETSWVNLVAKTDLEGLQGPEGYRATPAPKATPVIPARKASKDRKARRAFKAPLAILVPMAAKWSCNPRQRISSGATQAKPPG